MTSRALKGWPTLLKDAFMTKADLANGPGSEVASSVLSSTFVITGVVAIAVPGWQITVPANSGPIELEVVGGVCINVNTGTVGASTKINTFARISDDLNVIVAFGGCDLTGVGANVSQQMTPALGCLLPNNASDRTYRIEVQCDKVAVSGASASVLGGAPYPPRTLRALRR